MGYIDITPNYIKQPREITFKAFATDLKCFRVVKSRSNNSCSKCGRKLPSKTYIYSSDWLKFCLKCGDDVCDLAIKGYQDIINYIKSNKELLKSNKNKWEAQNILSQL